MKIQDILNQSKPCWKYAAMDQFKKWRCYTDKPKLEWNDLAEQTMLETFDIMLEVIKQRSRLFYEYADKKVKGQEQEFKL